jgi:hypothetical protein
MRDSRLTPVDWIWINAQEDRGLWPLWAPGPDGSELVEFWSSWTSPEPELVMELAPPARYTIRGRGGRLLGRGTTARDAFLRAAAIALVA